jgi:hypothetical protein
MVTIGDENVCKLGRSALCPASVIRGYTQLSIVTLAIMPATKMEEICTAVYFTGGRQQESEMTVAVSAEGSADPRKSAVLGLAAQA